MRAYSPDDTRPNLMSLVTGAVRGFSFTDLFARGTSGEIYWRERNSTTWSPSASGWTPLPGFAGDMAEAPAVTVVPNGGIPTMEIWARGREGSLWRRYYNGSSW